MDNPRIYTDKQQNEHLTENDFCPKCGTEMEIDHTESMDEDGLSIMPILVCPKCNK